MIKISIKSGKVISVKGNKEKITVEYLSSNLDVDEVISREEIGIEVKDKSKEINKDENN